MAESLAILMVLASPLSALGSDPARIAPVLDPILAKKEDRIGNGGEHANAQYDHEEPPDCRPGDRSRSGQFPAP